HAFSVPTACTCGGQRSASAHPRENSGRTTRQLNLDKAGFYFSGTRYDGQYTEIMYKKSAFFGDAPYRQLTAYYTTF
ncbi:MAG: hypothetical protein V2I97_19915, partial [Desulfococcaceae bacterium]|nr:hypothetical protein [Desulfococcaceae bacterium]